MDKTRSLFFWIISLALLMMAGLFFYSQTQIDPVSTSTETESITVNTDRLAEQPTSTSVPMPTSEPPTEMNTPEPTLPPSIDDAPIETPTASPTTVPNYLDTIEKAIEYVQTETVVVGVNISPPFIEALSENQYRGFDIDILNALRTLWKSNNIEFKLLEASERISCAAEQTCDLVISSITETYPRCYEQGAGCSAVYFNDGARLLVLKESGIETTLDLDGKIVSVVNGTTAVTNVEELSKLHKYETNPQAKVYADRETAINAVEQGVVSAYTTDGMILTQYESDALDVVGGEFSAEPYVIVANENNTGLIELINLTLRQIKLDGSYDALFQQLMGCRVKPFPIRTNYPDKLSDYLDYVDVLEENDGETESDACGTDQVADDTTIDTTTINVGDSYTVVRGDTLSYIARKAYGDPTFYPCIKRANNLDSDIIIVGDILEIPSCE